MPSSTAWQGMFTCPRRDQLTALRLHGMAACAHDLLSARKPPSLTTAIKQLIDAETVERRVRSICQLAGDCTQSPGGQYQMRIAKVPHHKDFATFDYGAAAVTKAQIEPFCTGQFTEEAHNLILVGGRRRRICTTSGRLNRPGFTGE